MSSTIVTILPKDEGFSPTSFGAISLCVRDFTLASRYQKSTIVISGVKSEGFEGIRFRPAPSASWYENRTRAYARHCISVINKEGAVLAEIHNRPQLLRLIAPKVSCKLALHLHNDPHEMRDAKTAVEREELLKLCDGVYCVSNFIRTRFLEGVDEPYHHKVHVVHNGIAIPETIPPKEKLIVFAGRMTEGKGALLLAQALTICLPQLKEWRAVLIGSDRHSIAEALTPRESAILNVLAPIAAQASMLGFLSHNETLSYFSRAAIAVVPSVWQEPFGRTAIEAMAYACATISSGHGALMEVTQGSAFTPEQLTAESIARAIVMLCADEVAREYYSQEARKRVQFFAIAKCTEALDKARGIILLESP